MKAISLKKILAVAIVLSLDPGLVGAMGWVPPTPTPQSFSITVTRNYTTYVNANWTPLDGVSVTLAMDGNDLLTTSGSNGQASANVYVEATQPHHFTLTAKNDAGSSIPAVFDIPATSQYLSEFATVLNGTSKPASVTLTVTPSDQGPQTFNVPSMGNQFNWHNVPVKGSFQETLDVSAASPDGSETWTTQCSISLTDINYSSAADIHAQIYYDAYPATKLVCSITDVNH